LGGGTGGGSRYAGGIASVFAFAACGGVGEL
jgi:hypothetical protein